MSVGAGGIDPVVGSGGSGGAGGAGPCVADNYQATVEAKPVDIIVAIDNTASMAAEIENAEQQFNTQLAKILDEAPRAVDYRVILLSLFNDGDTDNPHGVCISEPLGGIPDANQDGTCDSIPAAPVETARFFHLSIPKIGSKDALCQLIDHYTSSNQNGLHPNGYKDLLRPEALKFFLVVTDGFVECDTSVGAARYSLDDASEVVAGQQVAQQWDAAIRLLDPVQFGASEADRKYTFWSIIAQAGYMTTGPTDFGEPVPPSEAITTDTCVTEGDSSASNEPGTGFQALSILTDGYRYPVCGAEYATIFQLMAEGVIQGASAPCQFTMPDAPPGEVIDQDTLEIIYTPGNGGADLTFTQVADPASCNFTSFYVEGEQIVLCAATCAIVKADDLAQLELAAGCGTLVN